MKWIPWWGKQSHRYQELIEEYDKIIEGLREIDRDTFRIKPKISDKKFDYLDEKYKKIALNTFSFKELITKIEETDEDDINWIIRRWYDHKIHELVVCIFNFSSLKTKVEINPMHKTRDFYLNGIGFDIKIDDLPIWNEGYDKQSLLVKLQNIEYRIKFYSSFKQTAIRSYRKQNKIHVLFHYDDIKNWWDSRHDLKQIKRTIKDAIDNMILDEVEVDNEIIKCGIVVISTSGKDFVANVPTHKLLSIA